VRNSEMSMRLVPGHDEGPGRAGGKSRPSEQSLAKILRGSTAGYAGKLATMTHEEFVEIVAKHGAKYGQPGAAGVMVIGEGDWPLGGGDTLDKQFKALEGLERRAAGGLRVVSEEQFLEGLGLEAHRANLRQLFSTARLTEILEVPREAIRAWVRAGLIRPAKTELGVWYFDFREVSAARMLVDLTAAGVSVERIRRSLAKLQKWMPQVDEPLRQLAILEKTGPVLVRLGDGELSEPDGQLHFEFGSSPQGLSDAAVGAVGAAGGGAASPLRIAPGPRTAEQWLEQGLAQEREGYLDEAAASYRQSLMIGGPSAVTCFNLANVLRALGHKSQALERYSQAVEVEPDFADAWNNLGTLLAEMGRADDACAAFRRALAADPDDAQAHYNLADALHDLGRLTEAAPHWRAFLRYDSTSEWGRYARRRLNERA
jgi:DNA-binding transcriptional MerR regulator